MDKIENSTGYFRYFSTLGQTAGWWGLALLITVLGAHFFRASEYGTMACCFGALFLHCGHTAWKLYAVSFFLLWGAVEWGMTAFQFVEMRMQAGFTWFRASLILFTVSFFTCIGAIAGYRRAEARDNAPSEENALLKGIVFITIFCLLYYLTKLAPFPILLLERFNPRWGTAQIFLMALYGVFILNLLLDSKRFRLYRKMIWLFFSLVFFSQFLAGILGVSQLLMSDKPHMPFPAFILFNPIYRGSFSMMLPLVIVAVLLAGSAWCGILCYFGAFDLCASSRTPVKDLPAPLRWMTRYGRICVLATGVMVAALLGFSGASSLTALAASLIFVFIGFLVMLLFSIRFNSMIHCTAFCPMGLVINALSRFSPWKMAVDNNLCDNCGACEKVCKYNAISTESRARGKTMFQCSLCMDCVSTCGRQAISIRAPGLAKTKARLVFIALLTVLHVLFLSLARG